MASASSSDSDEDGAPKSGYGALYGQTRLERAWRISGSAARLMRPGQIADPTIVHPRNDAVRRIAPTVWCVRSQHDDTFWYTVSQLGSRAWECNCLDAPEGNNQCKHILAARMSTSEGNDPSALSAYASSLDADTSPCWYPMGSAVIDRATGGHGTVTDACTGTTLVDWDAFRAPTVERVYLLRPAENGRPLRQAKGPSPAFFNTHAFD
jgi:hypothetical protein